MAVQKFSDWLEANQTDPRVVALNRLAARPLTINSTLGRKLGELMRATEAERSQVAA
jgi:hypothetical protein